MIAVGALAVAAAAIAAVVLLANRSPTKAEADTSQSAATSGEAGAPQSPSPTLSKVTIATSPDGSLVFVDGISKGRAPVTVELPVGMRVELRAESQGYASATRLITVEATPAEARIELIPLIDAGVAATRVDAPPVVTQPPKPPKRGGPREPRRNDRGSGSGSGDGSNQGFSPNDVL